MKLLFPALMALVAAFAADRPAPKDGKTYHAIFEMTTADTTRLQGLVHGVDNLRKALGEQNVAVEVVFHDNAIFALTRQNAGTLAGSFERLSKSGVVLAGCNNAMRARKISKDDLLPYAVVVPSGVAEIVKKQYEGWQYIRNAE